MIEPKIKIHEIYSYSFLLVSKFIQDPGFNVPLYDKIFALTYMQYVNAFW